MQVETFTAYVAEDGTRFSTEKKCLDYEFSKKLRYAGFLGDTKDILAKPNILAEILAERINARITKKRGASVYGGGHYAFYASNADSAFAEDFIAWVHANFYLVPKSK